MQVNGKPLVHKDALKHKKMAQNTHPFLSKKPEHVIVAGPNMLVNHNDTTNETYIDTSIQLPTIKVGPGLIMSTDVSSNETFIDILPSGAGSTVTTRVESKPIFMIGLPCTTTDDSLADTMERLEKKMPDYHVLLLKNLKDVYTAKMFKETGIDTLSIDEIKRYIDQKTKQ